MEPTTAEAVEQVEQSGELSLTNSVQITTRSNLLSHGGPLITIRLALKVRITNNDNFEEHLINTNGMNLHTPPASENFIRFVKLTNNWRQSFLNGAQGKHPIVQLVIVDMPKGLPMPGINKHLPMWNSYTTLPKFLMAVFGFVESHLDDDEALLLIHPIGLQGHLCVHLKQASMKVQCN